MKTADVVFIGIIAVMVFISVVLKRFFCVTPATVRMKPEINTAYKAMVKRKYTLEQMYCAIENHKKIKRNNLNIVRSIPDKILTKPGVSIGEFLCQTTLNDTFKENFEKIRPEWLKNPKTKRNLELDMWNPKHRIALEYQGSQHYLFPNTFHGTYNTFEDQVNRDALKVKLCKINKVTLLVVPYTVPHEHIPVYIYCELITKWKTSA